MIRGPAIVRTIRRTTTDLTVPQSVVRTVRPAPQSRTTQAMATTVQTALVRGLMAEARPPTVAQEVPVSPIVATTRRPRAETTATTATTATSATTVFSMAVVAVEAPPSVVARRVAAATEADSRVARRVAVEAVAFAQVAEHRAAAVPDNPLPAQNTDLY